MDKGDLKIDGLTRIVGHTSLDVEIKGGRAVKAKLEVEESRRFYRQAVLGKSFRVVPQMVSRICGTCGLAHALCSIEAMEKLLGFVPSEQTVTLRKLASNSNMLRDHAMHLYFLALPDLLGFDSVLDFDKEHNSLIHDALEVKKAGNILGVAVAGRSIHSTNIILGGFGTMPDKVKIKDSVRHLKLVRPKVLELARLFAEDVSSFPTKKNYVALKTKGFNFLEGYICSSNGKRVEEKDFARHLTDIVKPYSTADSFKYDGQPYMVGALSRINLNKKELHKDTRKDVAKWLKIFPTDCIFKNNLAQAIEMLHCIDSSLEMMQANNFKTEKAPRLNPVGGVGVGVIEAPRGTLYHQLSLGADGVVKDAEFVIPTAQNIIKIEQDIVELVNGLLGKVGREEIRLEIEKLIRAYDPCMNCATHFLKVNWL